jgi:hypothetical protein
MVTYFDHILLFVFSHSTCITYFYPPLLEVHSNSFGGSFCHIRMRVVQVLVRLVHTAQHIKASKLCITLHVHTIHYNRGSIYLIVNFQFHFVFQPPSFHCRYVEALHGLPYIRVCHRRGDRFVLYRLLIFPIADGNRFTCSTLSSRNHSMAVRTRLYTCCSVINPHIGITAIVWLLRSLLSIKIEVVIYITTIISYLHNYI